MVTKKSELVTALAHGPATSDQHVGANRSNSVGSVQAAESINEWRCDNPTHTWSTEVVDGMRRLRKGNSNRSLARCALGLTATHPPLLIVLAAFAP